MQFLDSDITSLPNSGHSGQLAANRVCLQMRANAVGPSGNPAYWGGSYNARRTLLWKKSSCTSGRSASFHILMPRPNSTSG